MSTSRFNQHQSSENNGYNRRRNFARSNAFFESSLSPTCYPKINFPPQDLELVDVNGINLFDFIQTTLHKNPHDRKFMLNLEREMLEFVKNSNVRALKFGPTSSYNRMLIHRVAAFFGLDHNVDNTACKVICTKTPESRVPLTPFHVMIFHDLWSDKQPRRFAQSFDYDSANQRHSQIAISTEAADAVKRASSFDASQAGFPTVEKVGVHRSQQTQLNGSALAPLTTSEGNGQDESVDVANLSSVTPQQHHVERGSTGTSLESDETDLRLQQMPIRQYVSPVYAGSFASVIGPTIPYNYVMVNGNRVVPRTDITALIQHFGAVNVEQRDYESAVSNERYQQSEPAGYYYHGAFYPTNRPITSYVESQTGDNAETNNTRTEQDVNFRSSVPNNTALNSAYSAFPNANGTSYSQEQNFNVSGYMSPPIMFTGIPPVVPQYVSDFNNPNVQFVPMNYTGGVNPNGTCLPAAPYYVFPQMSLDSTFSNIAPDPPHIAHA